MSINILAIESSCDDTSAAIISDGKVLSNVVSSQDKHALLGGVVPEVASREHLRLIMPVVRKALDDAQISLREVNAVAITRAPGLLGSLHVGVSFAKSVSLAMDLPIIDVNHMDAHIMANFIDDPKPSFPFLCLTVSGGHTQISIVRDYLNVEIIGSTIDDAAGEAFDKTGKILGLDYPSGPIMDRMAQQGQAIFTFTEPNIPNLDFSFSGLKTAILYFLKKEMDKNRTIIHNSAISSTKVINRLCEAKELPLFFKGNIEDRVEIAEFIKGVVVNIFENSKI